MNEDLLLERCADLPAEAVRSYQGRVGPRPGWTFRVWHSIFPGAIEYGYVRDDDRHGVMENDKVQHFPREPMPYFATLAEFETRGFASLGDALDWIERAREEEGAVRPWSADELAHGSRPHRVRRRPEQETP